MWLLGTSTTILAAGAISKDRVEYNPQIQQLININRNVDVQRRVDQDPNLILVIAISGSGHRAAKFALGSLLAL